MGSRDPRVDAYIEKSAEFAQPVLHYLREQVHENCPQVEEAIKWGMPHFMYHGMFCGMAAFKQHCAFGFWKSQGTLLDGAKEDAMGQFGRITSLKDLPNKTAFKKLIKAAMALKENPPTLAKKVARTKKPELPMPEILDKALKRDKHARTTFENFSPSHQREYIEWILEAKTEATRDKRLATTLAYLGEGKTRHWKYQAR